MVKDYRLNTKKVYTQIGGNEVNVEHLQDMLYVGSWLAKTLTSTRCQLGTSE
jgi:hypothetical protein